MDSEKESGGSEGAIDYDGPPVTELELDGVQYRVDAGRGAEVAVSRRAAGTWAWTPAVEGRWDGVRLKAKGLDRLVVEALAQGLRGAAESAD